MDYESVWPYFACMAILLVVANAPVLATQGRRQISASRRSNIDGLRGFLAFGVVFHHGAVYRQYLLDGHWGPPPSSFYAALGPVGVSMFFMITSYLFWGRLIDARGAPNWTKLYVGRIFRLFPLYLFAIGAMILLVFVRTGFSLNVPPGELAAQIMRWSLGGMVAGPDINAWPHTSLLLAGVTWTLWFEWRFYAALLPLSLAARSDGSHLWFAIGGAVASLSWLLMQSEPTGASSAGCFVALFFVGMVCASLERCKLTIELPNWLGSTLALLALLACVTRPPDVAFSAGLVIPVGLAFYLIVSGADLFGLLTQRGSLVIGDMSYSVYLLHGLVYSTVFAWRPVADFSLAAPEKHWVVVLACALAVLLVSSITHARVERPGMAWGKQVSAALDALRMRRRRPVPL